MSKQATILPVIICGGAGSRLWPLSRTEEPKQFAPLIGETTLFQQTLQRFGGADFAPPAVICNAAHKATVERQAAAIGVALGPIVLEPFGRNTAACGVVSALLGEGHAAVLMVPADHRIANPDSFEAVILAARPLVADGHLVTFGITPTHPHTGFGYIEQGEAKGPGHAVEKFHEKPTKEKAESYLATGKFVWNAGIFMFSPDALLAEFECHAPDVLTAVRAASRGADGTLLLNPDLFAGVPDISFDYAIAERTDRAAVMEADMGWSDIGSYSALFELRKSLGEPLLAEGSVVADGEGVAIDSDDPNIQIAVAGLDNVGVVLRAGKLLVVNLGKDQTVKSVVQALKT